MAVLPIVVPILNEVVPDKFGGDVAPSGLLHNKIREFFAKKTQKLQ
jgi:hypothetical protein